MKIFLITVIVFVSILYTIVGCDNLEFIPSLFLVVLLFMVGGKLIHNVIKY